MPKRKGRRIGRSFTNHRIAGTVNRVVLAKVAHRRIRSTPNNVANSTILQVRTHHRLLPMQRGITNRRTIRNEHRRRRRRA